MELEEIKRKVRIWSGGLELVGETKEELQDSLERISYDLTNEITDEEQRLSELIDSLDIDDCFETNEN